MIAPYLTASSASSSPPQSSDNPFLEIPVAEMSRPKRQFKREKQQKNTHRRAELLSIAERTHWKAPWIWPTIAEVASRHLWSSPHAIVHELQVRNPTVFENLTPQVLGRWIEMRPDGTRGWKDSVLNQVKKGYSPGGESTRVGVLVSDLGLLCQCGLRD